MNAYKIQFNMSDVVTHTGVRSNSFTSSSALIFFPLNAEGNTICTMSLLTKERWFKTVERTEISDYGSKCLFLKRA